MTLKLSTQDKTCLDGASSLGVQGYAAGLVRHFTNDNWLDNNNIYRNNPGRQVTKAKKGKTASHTQQLGEYIAASVPLHLVDGWSYFGQALYAHACGHPTMALHLGYYAEIRATMSLLASQGIGIFARHHCVVEAGGGILFLPTANEIHGTHEAIWAYLDYWLDSKDAGSMLGDVIRPYTVPLEEWIQELPCAAGTWNRVAASMVHDFGLDLERLAKDRGLRNRASYDPSELLGYYHPSNNETVEFVIDTIHMLEPSGTRGGFGVLDQHLLGQAIDHLFEANTGLKPRDNVSKYEKEVDEMLRKVGDVHWPKPATRQFLIDERLAVGHDSLVRRASTEDYTGDPRPLLSRAAVLLRVATGTAHEFMRESSLNLAITGSWWQDRAKRTGLWTDGHTPVDMIDSWADVDSALEELESWYAEDGGQTRDLFQKRAYAIWEMINFGRLALIGLS